MDASGQPIHYMIPVLENGGHYEEAPGG